MMNTGPFMSYGVVHPKLDMNFCSRAGSGSTGRNTLIRTTKSRIAVRLLESRYDDWQLKDFIDTLQKHN